MLYCNTCVFSRCVARARLDVIPGSDDTSCSTNLLRELFQVADMIVTKSVRFALGILRVRSLVLMHVPT